jgi:hypothetical protein
VAGRFAPRYVLDSAFFKGQFVRGTLIINKTTAAGCVMIEYYQTKRLDATRMQS